MFDECNHDADERDRQLRLNEFNRQRFSPALPDADWRIALDNAHRLSVIDREFLEGLRADVSATVADAPTEPDAFRDWYDALEKTGPGQNDPLFPWLAEEATLPQMKWFLTQEVAGEAGFEDLTALTQLRLDSQPKLEMARNYWDEMGRGQAKGMHGPMLHRLSLALELDPRPEQVVWETLALANAMAAMAWNRQFAFHSVGALGVIELTAPGRAAHVTAGLKRLGVAARDRHYFSLHSVLDIKHSKTWNAEVIDPLVRNSPESARAIAEGALIRLHCGARCYERYRMQLWRPDTSGQITPA